MRQQGTQGENEIPSLKDGTGHGARYVSTKGARATWDTCGSQVRVFALATRSARRGGSDDGDASRPRHVPARTTVAAASQRYLDRTRTHVREILRREWMDIDLECVVVVLFRAEGSVRK